MRVALSWGPLGVDQKGSGQDQEIMNHNSPCQDSTNAKLILNSRVKSAWLILRNSRKMELQSALREGFTRNRGLSADVEVLSWKGRVLPQGNLNAVEAYPD